MMSSPSDDQNKHAIKARNVIEDAFRRADKDDDGALSLEEFQNYFDDQIISRDELKELFHKIDTHNTNTIDTGELCEYFSQYWSPFESVFATVDDLANSITQSLHVIARQLSEKSRIDKFATRFFIKEIIHHIDALEGTLNVAIETLEEGEANETKDKPLPVEAKPAVPRWQQKLDRSLSRPQEENTKEAAISLNHEVSRLSALLDKLESKVVLNPIEEEVVSLGKQRDVLMVTYNAECLEEEKGKFREILKGYVQESRSQPDCLHVGIRVIADTLLFTIYEVWRNEESWNSYCKVNPVDKLLEGLLAKGLDKQTASIPDSWWPTLSGSVDT